GTTLADEAAQGPIHAVSANGVYTLDITPYHVVPFPNRRFSVKKDGVLVSQGEIGIAAGRVGYVENDGAFFVLDDPYDGLVIYDSQGRLIRHLLPEAMLSPREL